MSTILVTDGEQRSTLAAVRSLGRAGHEVHVVSSSTSPLAGASVYARSEHLLPDPTVDAPGYMESLRGLLTRVGAHVLLPMTDASTTLVLGMDPPPEVIIPMPLPSSWQEATDKAGLARVAQALDVPVPKGRELSGRETDGELREMAREIGFPVILKPHRSVVLQGDRIQKTAVRMVVREDDLPDALEANPESAFPMLLQEHIVGSGLGGFFLAESGRIRNSFAHMRLREMPPGGGVSVLRESVSLRADIREYSGRLLKHFGWSGVAMVEFKEDARTGVPYLMEINGRLWGSLQLAIDSGVDFPSLLIDQFLRSGFEPSPSAGSDYRLGVRSRWLWGDVDHLLWMLTKGEGARAANPNLPGSLGALLRFLLPWRPGLRYEVLSAKDPRPFLRESIQWLKDVLENR